MPSRGLTGWAGAPRNGASVPVAAKAEAVRNDRRETRGSDRVMTRESIGLVHGRPATKGTDAIQLCSHVGQAFRPARAYPLQG